MSTAAFIRGPSQPGVEAEHPNPPSASGPLGGVPQGGHIPGPDLGLAHPHLLTRPMFYIPAPPPAPFMHYQWPMPFYPPFNPFSGLGYGMMMPPFPPAPYMEPPAYFLPHAPVQPMEYRRPVHPQPHPSTAPFPAQPRRPRPPHPGLVRETVSFGVQTEPREGEVHGGSPLRSCADSGRGTAPSSPTSSTSSNQKNPNCEENGSQGKDLQFQIACTRSESTPGLRTPNPGERQSIQKMAKENNSPALNSRKVHLVRQENVESVEMPSKERRVSVPDILMSWGNETAQEEEKEDAEEEITADKGEKLPSYEEEVANVQSSTVVNEDLLDAETVDGDKVENEQSVDPKLQHKPHEHSLNIIEECSAVQDSVNEATLGEPQENAQAESGQSRRKMNESIWSVESLPGYIPSKEWLAQNTTVGAVILEMGEEVENEPPCDKMVNLKSRRNSSTDSVQMSESFICFSTPASKATAEQASSTTNEPVLYKLQKDMNLPDSPICDNRKTVDAVKEIERKETAEPMSSPKLQSLPVKPNKEKMKKSGDANKEKLEKRGETCKEKPETAGEATKEKLGKSGDVHKEKLEKKGDANRENLPKSVDSNKEKLGKSGDATKENLENGGDANGEKSEKGGGSIKEKTIILEAEKGDVEESSQKKAPETRVELLSVPRPVHSGTEVSPSKVDCGVQCSELHMIRWNAEMNHQHFNKSIDVHNISTRSEGYYGYGQKRKHYRNWNKGPGRQYGPQETCICQEHDRPGKPRGGKGRH